jgi:hypothetical protein
MDEGSSDCHGSADGPASRRFLRPSGKKIGVMLSLAHEWYVAFWTASARADTLGISTLTDSENDLQKGISIIDIRRKRSTTFSPVLRPIGLQAAIKRAAEEHPVIVDVVRMKDATTFAGNEQFNMTRETGKEVGQYIKRIGRRPINVHGQHPSLPT